MMRAAKIRFTKWVSRNLPPAVVYRILIRKSTIPDQQIFKEAFAAADPKKTGVDIGANRGIVSYFMSRRFPRVHSFEPNGELGAFLEKVLPANCTLHRCGLSEAAGGSSLSVIKEDGIPIHGRGRILSQPTDGDFAVQDIRLETLDAQNLNGVGFIKIDVEGHEENVIRGGLQTLRREKPVLVIEIEKRHTGRPVGDTLRLIESLGYEAFFFDRGARRPAREYKEEMQDPAYGVYVNDFLFLPK